MATRRKFQEVADKKRPPFWNRVVLIASAMGVRARRSSWDHFSACRFDFDDFGAQVRKDHGAEGARERARQVQYFDSS